MILFKSKKFNPLIPGYILFLTGLSAVGYFVENFNIQANRTQSAVESVYSPSSVMFYDMPRMEISMSSAEGQTSLMRLSLSLQIERKNLARVQDYQPRITDRIVSYLRKQDINDIRKTTSGHWLRDGLLHEINSVGDPAPVQDVIFRQFVVQ